MQQRVVKIAESRGETVVAAAFSMGAESGDIEATAAHFKIDPAEAHAIVAGITTRTDSKLAETGMSSELLGELLDEKELVQARRYAMRGKDAQLLALGRQAQERLMSWPERAPESFGEFFQAQFGGQWETRQGDDGGFEINTQEKGWVSWASLVKSGHVRPAKRTMSQTSTAKGAARVFRNMDDRFLIKL